MGKAFDYIKSLVFGGGHVPAFSPGNENNSPGVPLVAVGTYEFIQPEMFYGLASKTTNVPMVPPNYQFGNAPTLQMADPSGITGGGFSFGQQVHMPNEQSLFYDTSTGIYYNIG